MKRFNESNQAIKNERWQVIKFFLFVLIIITVVVWILTGCSAVKISDDRPAKMISYERVKKSPNYIVCVQDAEGNRYSVMYNSHCYKCDAVVPTKWHIGKSPKGKIFLQPIN